jgi:hypothetical protein
MCERVLADSPPLLPIGQYQEQGTVKLSLVARHGRFSGGSYRKRIGPIRRVTADPKVGYRKGKLEPIHFLLRQLEVVCRAVMAIPNSNCSSRRSRPDYYFRLPIVLAVIRDKIVEREAIVRRYIIHTLICVIGLGAAVFSTRPAYVPARDGSMPEFGFFVKPFT